VPPEILNLAQQRSLFVPCDAAREANRTILGNVCAVAIVGVRDVFRFDRAGPVRLCLLSAILSGLPVDSMTTVKRKIKATRPDVCSGPGALEQCG
jgi:hypothetical protein